MLDFEAQEYNEPNAHKWVLWNTSPTETCLELTLPLEAESEVVAKTLASLEDSGWYLCDAYPVFLHYEQ